MHLLTRNEKLSMNPPCLLSNPYTDVDMRHQESGYILMENCATLSFTNVTLGSPERYLKHIQNNLALVSRL